MKYLYYALHLLYVKVFHVQKEFPPIINITGVMAFLIGALCYSIVNLVEEDIESHQYPYYSFIAALLISLILYEILYNYYKTREAKLLKEMENKPLWIKITSILGSLLFIVLVVKLWMFDGMSDLYQLIKQYLFQIK